MTTTSTPVPRVELARDLNLRHSIAVVVGTVIGSGIFLVPAEMMRATGSASLVYLAWLVGGVLSFFGAMTYAELGSMRAEAGGEYAYLRDGFGPSVGFLCAWSWFMIAKPASIATVAAGIIRVLGSFEMFAFLAEPAIGTMTWGKIVGSGLILIIMGVNIIGVRRAGEFQFFFMLLKILCVGAIVILGFSYAGNWGNFSDTIPVEGGAFAGFMVALVAALWAYDGWNDLTMVAGEVSDPKRNIPLGLIVGIGIVAVLYMLMNAAILYVMPAAEVASSERPASQAMLIAVGVVGAAVVSIGTALSMFGTLNGVVLSGSRMGFAPARDGYFFDALASVNPGFRTPANAIIVQCLIGVLLLNIGGTFQDLFSLAIFAEWLFYMLAASTIFIFRKREPERERSYRTWGYPVVPALFIVAAAVLLYFTFMENWPNSIIGSLVILAGLPVFYFFARRRKAA